MQVLSIIGDILGVISLVVVIGGAVFLLVMKNDINTTNTDLVRKRLEEEKEFFQSLGVVMYYAELAADELGKDPASREDLLESIYFIDDCIIEDRINFT